MDHSSGNMKNILVELEALRSKECIFKMKETNLMRDKEILEDSIKKFQTDLQDKSEQIRLLRRDLDTQSSDLYKDLQIKNNELEKALLEKEDVKKQNAIFQETIDHHVLRIETLKFEMEKQQKFYEREIDCKSRLSRFYESSSQQKEQKLQSIVEENDELKTHLSDIENQLARFSSENRELSSRLQEETEGRARDRREADNELQRLRAEMQQLESDGISERYLTRLNPTAAATLKVLHESRTLMDVYTELHSSMARLDRLEADNERLSRLNRELLDERSAATRLADERSELVQTNNDLKSRLLSLVGELRAAGNLRSDLERQLLLTRRTIDRSESEIGRLNEQVRLLIVQTAPLSLTTVSSEVIPETVLDSPMPAMQPNIGVDVVVEEAVMSPRIQETGDTESEPSIKLEAVGGCSNALYTSVGELQTINRSLRLENERLKDRLDQLDGGNDTWRQRCRELEPQVADLRTEIDRLRQENSANQCQIHLQEKQIDMLRYLGRIESHRDRDNRVENNTGDISLCVEINECGESDGPTGALSSPVVILQEKLTKQEIHDEQLFVQQRQQQESINQCNQNHQSDIDSAVWQFMEDKKANDDIYRDTIEQMRTQIIDLAKKSGDLQNQLENCNEQLKEEKELNEKYRQECSLLRSLNRNLSNNTANLESHIDDLKLKIDSKITLLAQRKAEIDSLKNVLDIIKSEQMRLRLERDELLKTVDIQEQIMANITSLQTGAGLADHSYRSNMEYKLSNLNSANEALQEKIKDCNEKITDLNRQLAEEQAAHERAMKQAVDTSEIGCQIAMLVTETNSESISEIEKLTNIENLNKISDLQQQLDEEKSTSNEKINQLQMVIDKSLEEIKDLKERCAFLESQIKLQETARQEILNENIKITEEAHKMNASLKLDLHNSQEELASMKIRLEDAENVAKTVQEVIDKYVKEANEAKAKYKRELTLHAADSKLLETAHREIEALKSNDKSIDKEFTKLKLELNESQNQWRKQTEDLQFRCNDLESKLQDCENRNEKLYEQLRQINNQEDNASYLEIIEDLRNQINIIKMSTSLSNIQIERYENEISRLREELNDMKEQSCLAIDRLNRSQTSDETSSVAVDAEVIRESNHVLRQQKENLDRQVNLAKSEIEELNEQLSILQSTLSDVKEEKNILLNTKMDLEEEKNRWKDRCTKLVERAEQMDPEQYRIACNDRDKLRKQVVEFEKKLSEMKIMTEQKEKSFQLQIEEENRKLLQEGSRIMNLENDLGKTKCIIEEIRKEANNFRLKLEEEKEKSRKNDTLVAQLKDIGRKHKGESEKRRQTIVELEQKLSKLDEQLMSYSRENEQLKNNLENHQQILNSKMAKISELENFSVSLENINKENAFRLVLKENLIRELNENLNQLKAENTIRSLKRHSDSMDDTISDTTSVPITKKGRFELTHEDIEEEEEKEEDEIENEDEKEGEYQNENEEGEEDEYDNENEEGKEDESENENEEGKEDEYDNENEEGKEDEYDNENEEGKEYESENENEEGKEDEYENENEEGKEDEYEEEKEDEYENENKDDKEEEYENEDEEEEDNYADQSMDETEQLYREDQELSNMNRTSDETELKVNEDFQKQVPISTIEVDSLERHVQIESKDDGEEEENENAKELDKLNASQVEVYEESEATQEFEEEMEPVIDCTTMDTSAEDDNKMEDESEEDDDNGDNDESSVVIIDESESEEKDMSNCNETEEEDAFISVVENSLRNNDMASKKVMFDSSSGHPTDIQHSSSVPLPVSESGDNNSISTLNNSEPTTETSEPQIKENQNSQVSTRGRLRRLLRRPNPMD